MYIYQVQKRLGIQKPTGLRNCRHNFLIYTAQHIETCYCLKIETGSFAVGLNKLKDLDYGLCLFRM